MNEFSDYEEYKKLVKEKRLVAPIIVSKPKTKQEIITSIFEQLKYLVKENPEISKTKLTKELSKFSHFSESWIINLTKYFVYKNKIKIYLTGNRNEKRVELIEEPLPSEIPQPSDSI